jgi:hypothetical protein
MKTLESKRNEFDFAEESRELTLHLIEMKGTK